MAHLGSIAAAADTMATHTTPVFTAFDAQLAAINSTSDDVWPTMREEIAKTEKETAGPLASIATAFNWLAEALNNVRANLYSLRNAARDTLAEIFALFGQMGNPAGRQSGGPVRAKTAYIVGEAGPELFVPKQSGEIIPSSSLMQTSGGGGTWVFNFPNYVGSRDELIREVRRGLYDVNRRNPGALPGVA